jgi:hypothetical protein
MTRIALLELPPDTGHSTYSSYWIFGEPTNGSRPCHYLFSSKISDVVDRF